MPHIPPRRYPTPHGMPAELNPVAPPPPQPEPQQRTNAGSKDENPRTSLALDRIDMKRWNVSPHDIAKALFPDMEVSTHAHTGQLVLARPEPGKAAAKP